MVEFTFYGDLLGIASTYRQSPGSAYQKLDSFYNHCFRHLRGSCIEPNTAKINLFSDSIFFWGNDARSALELLKGLFIDLISDNLFLRGAIVHGKLEFEPRFTVDN
jgi:hypothetical protein